MDYCILSAENTIEDIIVCDSDIMAQEFGAVPSYDGARIGEAYNPPGPAPTEAEQLRADVDFLAAMTGVTL